VLCYVFLFYASPESFIKICSELVTHIASAVSILIEPKVHCAAYSLLLLLNLEKKWSRRAAFASLFLYPILFCLKILVGRARPYMDLGPLFFNPASFSDEYASFPSSHAAALGLFVSIFTPKYWKLLCLLGFVRVVQGAHFCSDVVVGFCMGFFIPKVTDPLLRFFENRWPLNKMINLYHSFVILKKEKSSSLNDSIDC
jgi:membrane-associated phospholipid phosphatase